MSVPGAATMCQEAAYPTILAELVASLAYRPGWRFELVELDRGQGSVGLTLDIVTRGINSYEWHLCEYCMSPVENYRVHHYMPVPPAAYDRRSWQRWLLDQILLVERHEACEFFQLAGERPYAPHHGPGNDPYIVFDHGTDIDVRTSFRGDLNLTITPTEGNRPWQSSRMSPPHPPGRPARNASTSPNASST